MQQQDSLGKAKVGLSTQQPWYIGLPKMRSSAKFRENFNL